VTWSALPELSRINRWPELVLASMSMWYAGGRSVSMVCVEVFDSFASTAGVGAEIIVR
jgi:hypothetical protein